MTQILVKVQFTKLTCRVSRTSVPIYVRRRKINSRSKGFTAIYSVFDHSGMMVATRVSHQERFHIRIK